MTAFFDTSAVIALSDTSQVNHQWSLNAFNAYQAQGPIIINDIVYAEFSAGMPNQTAVDAVLNRFGFDRLRKNDAALFQAGQRFLHYKRNNAGPKLNVLSDFFIGAAAQDLQIPLITANPKDFRSFYSGLIIVSPTGTETVP